MILASILITSDGKLPAQLPPVVQENIESLKRNHEDLEHTLFDDSMIRDFLSVNFDSTVLAAYDELVPYSYKADLARYCILYKLGGVYADLSFFIMSPFAPTDDKLAVFRDPGTASPWDIYTGLFAAPAGHKALKKSIEMVCDNVRRRYCGPTSICPTGPTLFGKAIALSCEPDEVLVGETFRPHNAGSATCLVNTHTDTLVAVSRKNRAGSLETLGIANGNNYNDLWHAQNIYKSDSDNPKIWSAKWLHHKRFTKGALDGDVIRIEGADTGTISWGPYTLLGPGEYVASVVCDGGEAYGDLTMDVVARLGKDVLARSRVSAIALAQQPLRLPFKLREETPSVEVRLHSGGPHKISVKQVRLEKGTA